MYKRQCVNSISLKFKPDKPKQISKAYFASGCFWGTEYYFQKLKGVKETTVGFMGGSTKHPTYKEVCSQKTGHFETVEIEYDPEIVSYESLVKFFFETHDFTQTDGQGPDIGTQYLSVIFYADQKQKKSLKNIYISSQLWDIKSQRDFYRSPHSGRQKIIIKTIMKTKEQLPTVINITKYFDAQ